MNSNNNYLNLIIKELNSVYPENFSQTIHLISTRKNAFNKFKREISNNISIAKNNANLMWFSLLVGCRFEDSDFVNLLIDNFDFNSSKNISPQNCKTDLAKFAKAIYCLKKSKNEEAKNLLWQVYQSNLYYFEHRDFVDLQNLLAEFFCDNERKILLEYLTTTYPQLVEYQRYYLDFLISNLNTENFAENQRINELLNSISKNADDSNDWQHLSTCSYNLGNVDDFFAYFEKSILTLKYHPSFYELPKHKISFFPAEECLQATNEFLDILENAGEKPFLIGGTLLGLYRDGKLMDYDKDSDLAIIVDEKDPLKHIKHIVNVAESSGKFIFSEKLSDIEILKKIHSSISFTNEENSINIDIFLAYKKDGFLYHGLSTKLANFSWQYPIFDIVKTKLNDRFYYTPSDIEMYLTRAFGNNWREPIKIWDSLINCPNITADSKLAVYYYGTMRFHEALRQHKYAKALNYYEQLKNRWQYPFTPEMCEKIENYLEKIKDKK